MTTEEAVKILANKVYVLDTTKYSQDYIRDEIAPINDAVLLAVQELAKQNADGCEGCKYIHKDEFEMPCLNCKRNKMDYWRADERRTDETD